MLRPRPGLAAGILLAAIPFAAAAQELPSVPYLTLELAAEATLVAVESCARAGLDAIGAE